MFEFLLGGPKSVADAKKVLVDAQKSLEEAKAAEEAKAKAVAPAPTPTAVQAVQAAGGGRRRKTSRKSPSKKRATKSMYSKIKKWIPFK